MKKLKLAIKKCTHWMCGKNPKIKKFKNIFDQCFNYEISCFGCGHSFTEFGKTKTEAIKKWNKRMKR